MADYTSYDSIHSREDMGDLLAQLDTDEQFLDAAKFYINRVDDKDYALNEILDAHKRFLKKF